MQSSRKELIFISHANPEDNDFTLWLALRLASLGYPVWTDLTELLGGERFWNDIEDVIRNHTTKFLYVLSETSNTKQGPLDELHLALSVQREMKTNDFIIPLKIDGLDYSDINIRINPINNIDFSSNWASGLEKLIAKLEKDSVQKREDYDEIQVSTWWKNTYTPGVQIEDSIEEYVSNELKVDSFPDNIFVHSIGKRDIRKLLNRETFPFPYWQHKESVITYASPDIIEQHAKIYSFIGSSSVLSVSDIQKGEHSKFISPEDINRLLIYFLSSGFKKFALNLGLKVHYLSGGHPCYYFWKGQDRKVDLIDVLKKKSYRYMYSFSEAKQYYWHFGISIRPALSHGNQLKLYILPNVLFSDDGENIWDSASRLHTSRRSHCKSWYNKDWADRILGLIQWLANGDEELTIPLSNNHSYCLPKYPTVFQSPVSYTEPVKKGAK